MKLIIDRIEGDIVVCEVSDTKEIVNLPLSILENAKEGSVVTITISEADTLERRKNIEKLMDDVWGD